MCGIYGELVLAGDAPGSEMARLMGRAIVHRGPDDDGLYTDERVALGLRRLSIIDLEGGHQPIASEDGTVVVVCNGEIYNFRELRQELLAAGHVFRTHSDVEVLVHLYEQHGDGFATRLRGMFGFALWDARRRRLLIGRDRLGIKPVYYARLGRRVAFASEAKAITARPDYTPDLDPLALRQFLMLGYVPNPMSLLAGIRKLPPATTLVIENGRLEERRYWEFSPAPESGRGEADWCAEIRTELQASVEAQMVSDVPIGAFLSGGIDSSLIVACMSRSATGPVKTYSIGYSGTTGAAVYNELAWAKKVAEHFRTDHHEILVQPQVVRLLPGLIWHMDEPTADSALLTSSLVAEFARRDVKVILSGVGGDELFGGYDRYQLPYRAAMLRQIPGGLRRWVLDPLLARLPVARHARLPNLFRAVRKVAEVADLDRAERYHRVMEVLSAADLDALLPGSTRQPSALMDAMAQYAGCAELDQIMAADLRTQLADDLLLLTDKVTMAHSLECRVPLLDERLVDLAARIPSGLRVRGPKTRYILRKAIADLIPHEVLTRPKRGFGAPFGAWLTRELAGVTRDLIGSRATTQRGLVEPTVIDRLLAEHHASRADHTDSLVALITLEIWCRLFLDRTSPEDLAESLLASAAVHGRRANA